MHLHAQRQQRARLFPLRPWSPAYPSERDPRQSAPATELRGRLRIQRLASAQWAPRAMLITRLFAETRPHSRPGRRRYLSLTANTTMLRLARLHIISVHHTPSAPQPGARRRFFDDDLSDWQAPERPRITPPHHAPDKGNCWSSELDYAVNPTHSFGSKSAHRYGRLLRS